MSLQTRLGDLITAIGTDYKSLRTWITGSSTGDLTGLTTTAKTSLVAAINEVKAAATGAPPSATETLAGVAEIATQVETTTGVDDTRFVTPLKLQQKLTAEVVPLSALDTDVTLSANSDSKIATQKAVKAYADSILDANNAYVYKGAIDASTNPNYPAANAGHTYKISVAGRIGGASGPVVEPGDSITALADGLAAGTHAAVGSSWLLVQTNIDGAFIGPPTSVAGNIVTFAGTTGKVGQDSGISIDADGTMAANSNTRVPTQQATRTFVAANYYNKTELGNPETDLVAAYTTAKA